MKDVLTAVFDLSSRDPEPYDPDSLGDWDDYEN